MMLIRNNVLDSTINRGYNLHSYFRFPISTNSVKEIVVENMVVFSLPFIHPYSVHCVVVYDVPGEL